MYILYNSFFSNYLLMNKNNKKKNEAKPKKNQSKTGDIKGSGGGKHKKRKIDTVSEDVKALKVDNLNKNSDLNNISNNRKKSLHNNLFPNKVKDLNDFNVISKEDTFTSKKNITSFNKIEKKISDKKDNKQKRELESNNLNILNKSNFNEKNKNKNLEKTRKNKNTIKYISKMGNNSNKMQDIKLPNQRNISEESNDENEEILLTNLFKEDKDLNTGFNKDDTNNQNLTFIHSGSGIRKNEKKEIKDIYYNKTDGFFNIDGCSCYMNSFLQILIHIPGLIESLKSILVTKKEIEIKNSYKDSLKIKDNINIKNSLKMKNSLDFENSLIIGLIKVAEKPIYDNLNNIKKIFKNLHYEYRNQQKDSQEFGEQLLKDLSNELSYLKVIERKWNLENFYCHQENKISEYKKAELNKLLNDENCQFGKETLIDNLFNYYESYFFDNNKIQCANFFGDFNIELPVYMGDKKCQHLDLKVLLSNKYIKNRKIIKLPKILMITLSRAIINQPLIMDIVKIYKTINFKKYMDEDFGEYKGSTSYSLYALNIRRGYSKNSGHSYCYILLNNIWFKFDDLEVKFAELSYIEKDLPFVYGIYYINDEYLNGFKNNS